MIVREIARETVDTFIRLVDATKTGYLNTRLQQEIFEGGKDYVIKVYGDMQVVGIEVLKKGQLTLYVK